MEPHELDLSEVPPSLALEVERRMYYWEAYTPGAVPQDDAPFGTDWWKYLYWIPRIKRELYKTVIGRNPDAVWVYLFGDLGIDETFFRQHYKQLIKVMVWMKKNNTWNHLGELK